MRTYREAFSNPYPEKGYLEPKTQGSTYLEWLYAKRRSAASDLARLRTLWVEDAHVRAQLLQLAKEYRFHGARDLLHESTRPRTAPSNTALHGRDKTAAGPMPASD
jgi:hypothetical protein